MTAPESGQSMIDRTGWTETTCADRDELRVVRMKVSSALTDIDGNYGIPIIYTEWEVDGEPVLRDYLFHPHTDRARCEHLIAEPLAEDYLS